MKGIVCGGIMPHGFSIIENIAGEEKDLFKPTRLAMENIGRSIMETKPDTIVILTPHGLRLKGYNAVYTCSYCRGSLAANNEEVELNYACDTSLAGEILSNLESNMIPVVGCNFGSISGTGSNIEMDWGTLIPLWFCEDESYKPNIVVVGPTREIENRQLIRLGEIINEACVKENKRVALIASADQGHCHDVDGPYGFNRSSKEYDEIVNSIIENDKLENLLNIEADLIDKAKPDSFWQLLILYGAIKDLNLKGELLSYEVPTYFGMTVASYF